jgi:hypothetical protein
MPSSVSGVSMPCGKTRNAGRNGSSTIVGLTLSVSNLTFQPNSESCWQRSKVWWNHGLSGRVQCERCMQSNAPRKESWAKSLRLTACCVASPMKKPQKPGGNAKCGFQNIVGTVPTQPSQTRSTTQNPKGSSPTKRNFEPVQEKEILSWCRPGRREEQKTMTILLKQKKKR